MRFGNRPGMLDVPDQQQGVAGAPVKDDNTLPGQAGVKFAKITSSGLQYRKGESIIASWSHSEPTSGDWIGLFLEGDTERCYKMWDWVKLESSTVTFTAPFECGVYNLRYFHNKSYVCHGTSKSFTIGPVFTLTPTSVSGTEIKLRVDQTFGDNCPNLWVAHYPHGEVNPKSYITYKWAKHGEELTFPVTKTGQWNFKAFSEKTYDHSATQSVIVPGSDTLTLTVNKEANTATVTYDISTVDPATEKVWIGIFHVEQEDSRYYRRYRYVTDRKGSFDVKAMQTAGIYEARLFANGTYDVLCRSTVRVSVQ